MGGTEAELGEAMDVGLLMGGTLSVKAVRHAYEVLAELGELHRPKVGNNG